MVKEEVHGVGLSYGFELIFVLDGGKSFFYLCFVVEKCFFSDPDFVYSWPHLRGDLLMFGCLDCVYGWMESFLVEFIFP